MQEAEHAYTTPKIAPTRRGLLGRAAGIAALTALAAAPVAAQATQSEPAVPHPDAELISLGFLLDEARAAAAEEYARWEAWPAGLPGFPDCGDELNDRTLVVADQIVLLRATTLDGLLVKLRVLFWYWAGDPMPVDEFLESVYPAADAYLLWDILGDLARIGNIPADCLG